MTYRFRTIGIVDRLNAAQQSIIDLLGKGSDERAPLSDDLPGELLGALTDGLEPIRDLVDLRADDEAPPARELWIGKRNLAMIHGCEAHYLADVGNTFRWTPASARGVVSHKAIELLINWRGDPAPADLVEEAIARLCDSLKGVGAYLEAMSEGERAELRGLSTDRVTKFLDCFPRLKAGWRPVTESSAVVELFDGALKLGGKADLTLGRVGEKVIIDLKSGGTAGSHREDLRFYALLETVRMGEAPRKVATYYLDSARAHPEDVSESMLWAALARTVDGVNRIVELERGGREASKRPGPQCRWCPLLEECEEGTTYLARRDDPDAEIEAW